MQEKSGVEGRTIELRYKKSKMVWRLEKVSTGVLADELTRLRWLTRALYSPLKSPKEYYDPVGAHLAGIFNALQRYKLDGGEVSHVMGETHTQVRITLRRRKEKVSHKHTASPAAKKVLVRA